MKEIVVSQDGWQREVMQIHQIELTSECNLRCTYCPHPHMTRAKEHMAWGTFEATLRLISHLVEQGSQTEVSLTGIGEPTLHPRFVEACARVRETIGWERLLCFSTNGIEISKRPELATQLKREGGDPAVFISGHRPEKAGLAYDIVKKAGLRCEWHSNFIDHGFNWAGQVEWPVRAPEINCEYLLQGWAVVLASGEITTCCLDAEGAGIVGDVRTWDGETPFYIKPYGLCDGCHMVVPIAKREVA